MKKGFTFPCAACHHPAWIPARHLSDTWFSYWRNAAASPVLFANGRLILDLSAFTLNQQPLHLLPGSANTVPQLGVQPEHVVLPRAREWERGFSSLWSLAIAVIKNTLKTCITFNKIHRPGTETVAPQFVGNFFAWDISWAYKYFTDPVVLDGGERGGRRHVWPRALGPTPAGAVAEQEGAARSSLQSC